jgi:hypothetical protein
MLFALPPAPNGATLDALAADAKAKVTRAALSWSPQPVAGGKHVLLVDGAPGLTPVAWAAALRLKLDARGGQPPAA